MTWLSCLLWSDITQNSNAGKTAIVHSGNVLVLKSCPLFICGFYTSLNTGKLDCLRIAGSGGEKKGHSAAVQGSFRALHLVFLTSGKEEREQDKEEKFESASKPMSEIVCDRDLETLCVCVSE